MIHVLIVDDDEQKRRQIKSVIVDAAGKRLPSIKEAGSAADAVALLESWTFELLILDINLPVRNDASPTRDGGMRLLEQLVRSGPRLRRPEHIVGLTAYEDLYKDFEGQFKTEAWQILCFRHDDDGWRRGIANLVGHVLSMESQKEQPRNDLAIVTALKPVELEAVLALDGAWSEIRNPGDDSVYHQGTFARNGKTLSVVAAAAIEVGGAAAACLTMKLITSFRPRYLAMVGIAAGISGNPGDIVVADQSWDYGSGKIISEAPKAQIFAPAPNYIAIDAELKEKLQLFCSQRRLVLAAIRESWPADRPSNALDVHLGPIASGTAVLESRDVIQAIKNQNRKVVGVEMETYGVYLACRTAPGYKPRCFSAKGICDMGIAPKTDEHQRYAAYTSARFAYEFSLDQLVS